jgi:3',5'-cyclic AMP phosphodiesterase CpdA
MPYTLPPLSRRRFLQGTIASAAGVVLSPVLRGADVAAAADPDRIILLSDLHVAADPLAVNKSVCMYDHLKTAVEQVQVSGLRPSAGFITGDLAYSVGEPGDYATLIGGLKPLREAGLPLHLTLGNHDHFENFRAAFPLLGNLEAPVASKQVVVVETPRANLFLLDSLDKPKMVPGLLGAAQLEWLAKALDARRTKPAVILVHHNPDALPTTHGLTDTDKLYETILPRKHVKAVVFGHTHTRAAAKVEGVHLINLPAVAYVFKQGEPSGWTDLLLTETGATFTLHTLDKTHAQNGEKYGLEWRVGS